MSTTCIYTASLSSFVQCSHQFNTLSGAVGILFSESHPKLELLLKATNVLFVGPIGVAHDGLCGVDGMSHVGMSSADVVLAIKATYVFGSVQFRRGERLGIFHPQM